MELPPETPLSAINGINPRFLPKLKKLHLETAEDLLRYFPARYEDFREVYDIADLEPGSMVTIRGVIEETRARHAWQRHMTIVEAIIADDTGSIRATWFNQPYLKETLRPGRTANFSGKVSLSEKGELYLAHPTYEFVSPSTSGEPAATKHTARLVPVYGETKGLTSKGIRFLIEPLLSAVEVKEWLPPEVLGQKNMPSAAEAFQMIHFPSAIEEAERARRRFAFEELFLLQLATLKQKQDLKKAAAAKFEVSLDWLKAALARLPFELTQSQKKALWEIIQDVEKPHPMNRLLQGDVGSGKTVIAAMATLIAAKNGGQAALMAPTEILARQHFETVKKLFASFPAEDQPATGFLAAGEAKVWYGKDLESSLKPKEFLAKLAKGEIAIAIGTHALIQKGVAWKALRLVVIDEQHRFGVRQRAELLTRRPVPHFLSMSATPIPRTLMLTIFGDLDVSLITELPSGRKKIITKIVPPGAREKAYEFIRGKILEGRQAFVICPRIEMPDTSKDPRELTPRELADLDVRSVKAEYDKLSKNIFPELRIGMLHGKMPAKGGSASGGKSENSKEEIMRDFQDKKIDILISTSVVEVGVDVPNAVIMMIEGSDRFGLAQLYQFRGRVGRGGHQSYCFLMTDADAKKTNERLKALVAAKNGFELAEYDLKLRGPGEFLGESQTGLPDVAMESLRSPLLVEESRAAAKEMLERDPALKSYPPLKERLQAFRKKIHLE